jgi:hypothetical protein
MKPEQIEKLEAAFKGIRSGASVYDAGDNHCGARFLIDGLAALKTALDSVCGEFPVDSFWLSAAAQSKFAARQERVEP